MFSQRLLDLVRRPDSRSGRLFTIAILLIILVSVVSYSVETIDGLGEAWRQALSILEIVIIVIFTLEYLLRLFAADSKLKFVLSPFGIIDLLAIVPFFLSFMIPTVVDLRFLRIVRLISLFKIFRFSRSLERMGAAFVHIKEELMIFGTGIAILIYLAAAGMYYFEQQAQPEKFGSLFDSLWWAVVTITTTGYGDAYPITAGGRVFAGFILLAGLLTVAVPSGLFATAMLDTRKSNKDKAG